MENLDPNSEETTLKERVLALCGEFLFELILTLLGGTTAGLYLYIGLWSLVLLFPMAFCIYYFVFKSE